MADQLSDVLREIIKYPVTRFWPDMDPGFIYASANNYTTGIPSDGMTGHDEMLVQAACQEECEARGWHVQIKHNAFVGGWSVCVMPPGEYSYDARATTAALAIATALRDALRAEQ